MTTIAKSGVYWFCGSCVGPIDKFIEKQKQISLGHESKEEEESNINALEQKIGSVETKMSDRISSLEDKINTLIALQGTIQDSVTTSVKNSVNENITKACASMQDSVQTSVKSVQESVKTWANVAGANIDIHTTDDEGFKLVAGRQKNKRISEYKQAMAEQKKSELEKESRESNIIVYRVPEQDSKDAKVRTEKDAKIVADLLNAIEVDATPCKISRMGKFDDSGTKTGSRPLKVCFENLATQQKVMENTSKLQHAPENLKKLSVNYDLTEEERSVQKTLVQEAQELSKNSKTHVYRVRGPPQSVKIVRFLLRKTADTAE